MSSPNVLLVVMDSVRARNTTLHGHRRDTTPFLSELAGSATVYESAYASAMWSLPSHVSLFTGLDVAEHGIREQTEKLRPGNTVFNDLREEGYATAAFSDNPFLTELDVGLKDAFDRVEGSSSEQLFPDGIDPHAFEGEPLRFLKAALESDRPLRSVANGVLTKLMWDYPALVPDSLRRQTNAGTTSGDVYADLFVEWQREQDGPWAACINFMDAHHPYEPRPEFDEWSDDPLRRTVDEIDAIPGGFYAGDDEWWKCGLLEHLYDGSIRQIDHQIEQIVAALREAGEFENTLLVVTSDHGEGFGERSRVKPELRLAGHNVGVHECLFHVPLVVKHPSQTAGRTVSELASFTRFPDVVRSACVDGDATAGFGSDGTALAVGDVGTDDGHEIRRHLDEEDYPDGARVRYRDDGDRITKFVEWGEDACVVEVVNARTSYRTEEDPDESAFDPFETATRADVRTRADESVSRETEQRLSDLGYV